MAADALRPALDAVNQRARRPHATLSAWVRGIQLRHAMPARLSELGVAADALAPLARDVMTERGLALNPRPVVDATEVLAILRAAF